MTIYRKFLYLFLAVGLFPILLLFLNHFFKVEDSYQNEAENGYKALSHEMGLRVSLMIDEGYFDLAALTDNTVIKEPDSSEQEILKELEFYRSHNSFFMDIIYIDTERALPVSGNGCFRDDWRDSSWFREVRGGRAVISDVFSVLHPYDVIMTISLPVFNPQEAVQGVLVGVIDLDRIQEVTRGVNVAGFSGVLITAKNGMIVESPRDEEILDTVNKDFAAGLSAAKSAISPLVWEDEKFIAVSSPVPSFRLESQSRWYLSLLFREKIFYSSYRMNRRIFLVVALLSTLFVFLVSYFSDRSVKKRVERIGQAVENLASVEGSPEICDDEGDELSGLVQKVNKSRQMLLDARNEKQKALDTLIQVNRSLLESNRRFQLAVDGANDAIWDWNIMTDELYLSKRWNAIAGLECCESIHSMKEWLAGILPEDQERVRQVLHDHLQGLTPLFSVEYRMINSSTGMRWILTRGLAFRNEDGVDIRMAGSHTDITTSRQLQDRLRFNAYHCELTNLPNRTKLRERIEESLLRAERDPGFSFTILYLDFDGFKHINDTFGHNTGDLLLKAIAERLALCVRPLDLISRIGGDEFVILLDGVEKRDYVHAVLERVMDEIRRPFNMDGHSIFISVSIGVAGMARDGSDIPDEIIQRADIAMYHAKNEGKSQYVFYKSSMGSYERRRWFLENELHKALGSECMQVHYQPVVHSNMEGVYGMEALLRWNHIDQGYISPAEFIPIAEETGFIHQITQWLLYQVCRQACRLNSQGIFPVPIRIAMNVSSRDFFAAEGLDSILLGALESTGCRPEWIALEVTEGTLIKNFELVSRQLKRIDEMGIVIELDDFGTGYSSLSYLNKFPLKILKVDRSFIMTMEESPSSLKLVQTIIHMAKDLGMKTIAEGVEEEGQRETLLAMGCDYIQGYLVSKPMEVETLQGFLGQWHQSSAGSMGEQALI